MTASTTKSGFHAVRAVALLESCIHPNVGYDMTRDQSAWQVRRTPGR